MKIKLIRDKSRKLVAVAELVPSDDGKATCNIETEHTTEIIEAPEDYSSDREKFIKRVSNN